MSPTPPANQDDPGKDSEDQGVGGIDMPQYTINAGSSSDSEDSDGDDLGYQGYQLLPQDPEAPTDSTYNPDTPESSEAQSSNHLQTSSEPEPQSAEGDAAEGYEAKVAQLGEENVDRALRSTLEPGTGFVPMGAGPSLFQVPETKNTEAEERREIWKKTPITSSSSMSEAEVDRIKSAMSGFSLPPSHTPSWAKTLSEEDWKANLMSQLNNSRQPVSSSSKTTAQSPGGPSGSTKLPTQKDSSQEKAEPGS